MDEKDVTETEHSNTDTEKLNESTSSPDEDSDNVKKEADLINSLIETEVVPEINDLEEPATDTLISFSHVENEVEEDMVEEGESFHDEEPGSN